MLTTFTTHLMFTFSVNSRYRQLYNLPHIILKSWTLLNAYYMYNKLKFGSAYHLYKLKLWNAYHIYKLRLWNAYRLNKLKLLLFLDFLHPEDVVEGVFVELPPLHVKSSIRLEWQEFFFFFFFLNSLWWSHLIAVPLFKPEIRLCAK